ncbi:hypothetical protein SEA_STROSAHL_3 [Gordonia phage Strosahl]|uniref:Uncharacterized protein n=5 Tax=Soupsvirus TaxID=1982562 RepID=A0A160DGJ9_9CAUD|nr:hypothetical protein BEN61_gp003 [Gordonia phage Rosalind]YP_009269026.1 hypothetical protein BEN62_gp003 [Gordonia phage KatherineG]YP_009269304.1 hypothetical protein BEN59_gp003 [Gordonia phage Soups]YP_009281617.1 hypothetical protein BIZ67_gp003 [Gordonia phage Remus]YP_009285947.1 hypothetical protein BIZ70_gp003 [Gordonia phage JSwag]YP_009596207.1 hypothetical protein FDH03_gp003 [Gordonia phage Strosahl]YP_009624521.1 hypothetical protein FDJ48_gp003 [Gordonia phage Waits]ASZ7388
MIDPEKVESQALGKELVDDFEAGPMTGPGRWAVFPDGTVLYTNDANVLFARHDVEETEVTFDLIHAACKLYERGETATAAFNLLKADRTVVSGDLATIA